MLVCLRCGKQLGANDKFCGSCGYQTRRQQTTSNNQAGNNGPSQTSSFVCLRCGKALKTTAKFCGSCGYPVQNSTQTQQTTTNNQTSYAASYQITTKEELIAEIDHMLVYFSKVQNLYDEYEWYVINRDAEVEKKRHSIISGSGDDDDPADFFYFLFVVIPYCLFKIVATIIAMIKGDNEARARVFLVISILSSVAGTAIYFFVSWPYSLLISIGCFVLSGLFCFLMVYFYIENNSQKRVKSNRMDAVLAQLKEYHRNYGNCLVSVNNANPRILRKAREYLILGKANTLNEALILACN